jgi:large subunit ribosomal protein L6
MSRIGKKPIPVPAGVTVDLSGQNLAVRGPKGEIRFALVEHVLAKLEDGNISVNPRDKSRLARSCWGMSRTMIANLIKGVTTGYSKSLEINGVGYRAAADAKTLNLQLGFSHDVKVPIPAGIQIKAVKPTEIEITGADRQKVGQLAAEIRSLRPPEPYKGKGIKYSTETIRRKEGKKK